MNLDELRTVQSKERQKDSLQNLRPSFYREVGEYIGDLEAERERVADAADDPFSSPEVGRLTDEIETATDVVEAVYERRMGKLVKQASLAAAGMPADDEGLTDEERDLFEDLVDRIESNKGRVLDVLEGKEPGASVDETAGGGDAGVTTADSAAERRDDAPPVPPDDPANGRTEDQRRGQRRAASDESSAGSGATANDAGSGVERETAVADEPASDESIPEETDETVSAADVMGGSPPTDASSPQENGAATGENDPTGEHDSAPPTSADSRPTERTGTASTETEPAAGTAETDAAGADAATASEPGRSDDAIDPRDVDRVTVRITRDVGAILGVDDREYTLSNDDVVTLPEQNATPLVERDAAEPLE